MCIRAGLCCGCWKVPNTECLLRPFRLQLRKVSDSTDVSSRDERSFACEESGCFRRKKFEEIRFNVNQNVHAQLAKDVERRFDEISWKVKSLRHVNPVFLIYVPHVFENRGKTDEFANSYMENWWMLLQIRLKDFSADFLSDVLSVLWSLHKATSGGCLRKFGLPNVLTLCDAIMRDIEQLPARKVELLLKIVNESFRLAPAEERKSCWVADCLVPSLDKWIRTREDPYLLGNILHLSTAYSNGASVSRHSLETAARFAFEEIDAFDKNANEEVYRKGFVNSLGFGEYFVSVDYNPPYANFWSLWYEALRLRRPSVAERALLCRTYCAWFNVAAKFRCENELEKVFDVWSRGIFDVSHDLVRVTADVASRKCSEQQTSNAWSDKALPALRKRLGATEGIRRADAACNQVFSSSSQSRAENPLDVNIFQILKTLDRQSKGNTLRGIGWRRLSRLVESVLKHADSLSAEKFYHLMQLLERYSTGSMFGVPSSWTGTVLLPAFSKWIRRNGEFLTSANAGHRVGGIVCSLAKFGLKPPEDVLEIVTRICCSELNLSSNGGRFAEQRYYNLLNSARAFLGWNFDPESCGGNFWNRWVSLMERERRNRGLTLLNTAYVGAMLRFDRFDEFDRVRAQWCDFVRYASNRISSETAFLILTEAEKKFANDRRSLDAYFPGDVRLLLKIRTLPLVVEAAFVWFAVFVFVCKIFICCYCIRELRRLSAAAGR